MPVMFVRRARPLRLDRNFEGTRLGTQLLALAYRTLVPTLPQEVPVRWLTVSTAAGVAAAPLDTEVGHDVPSADVDGGPVRTRLV